MFKYGSFRLFLVKIFFGLLFIFIGAFQIISIYSYSERDPGFNKHSNNFLNEEISNLLGWYGANIASYSLIFLGLLSLAIGLFMLLEGIKLFLGIKSNYLFLKFLANIFGIIFINIFILSTNFFNNSGGLISLFFFENINKILFSYNLNNLFISLIHFFILLVGLYLIILSFNLNLLKYKKILIIFKVFKFLRYLRFLKLIFKLKPNFDKKISLKNKNEPTFNKNNSVNFKKERAYFKSNTSKSKKVEVDDLKFKLPDKNLVNKSIIKNKYNKEIDKNNKESALQLEKTLSEYGVDGRVVGYKSGPIVTLFEFIPNAGIKSSKIIGLSDDIARAMSSFSARISSQPGKKSLGIEIPNSKRESVLFGDLIDDNKFESDNDYLRLALGKDISGEKVFADLEKMPHLLIAGTTGSGKSVGINTMILSLLYKFKPNECKLILIDPKMLELSVYEDIPHLLTPVVTDPKKAVFALKWVVREMENRYKLMSSVNVKNIESYNNKVLRTISGGRKLFREVQTGIDNETKIPIIEKREIELEKMPFIVVVIDEMADLMMVAGKEVEALVQRLAQMARASGIHLITATQRPSVDVITGTIKANFPSRISYKVASKFDSRTILNEMGAEQLLGSGDMLLLENGGNIKRLHGGYVSENEVEKVVHSIKNQAMFDYKKEISLHEESINHEFNNDLIKENNDELYGKAVEIIVKQQRVSTSFIQRYLQIGYNRAARIIEKMEEDGIITEANNAGKRHVLKKE